MRCYNKSCPMYNEQYEDGCNMVDYDYEDFENVCPDFMPETLPKMRCGNKRCDNYNSSNLSGCTTMTSIAHCPEMTPDPRVIVDDVPDSPHISRTSTKTKYEQIGTEIGRLVDEKQIAYGDSFGKTDKFIELLYPNGVKPYQYSDALALVRIFDKMMRIATKKDAFGESPFKDIAGYAMLGYGKDR